MRLADHIRVGDFLDELEAGGPGSGRHAGFGVGATLVHHGFKRVKNAGYNEPNYTHPDGHTAKVSSGKPPGWFITNKEGRVRQGIAGVHHPALMTGHLAELGIKPNVNAGGPGSGPRPGFGGFVRKVGDAVTDHPSIGAPMVPKPAAAPSSLGDHIGSHFSNQMTPMKSTPSMAAPKSSEGFMQRLGDRIAKGGPTFKDAPAAPAAPKPSFKERFGNALVNHPVSGAGK